MVPFDIIEMNKKATNWVMRQRKAFALPIFSILDLLSTSLFAKSFTMYRWLLFMCLIQKTMQIFARGCVDQCFQFERLDGIDGRSSYVNFITSGNLRFVGGGNLSTSMRETA
jgi:hypothetical protein